MKITTPNNSRGYVLLFVLVVSAIIAVVTVGFLNYYVTSVRSERVALASAQALSLAEAGIDVAISKLNANPSYAGESNVALGDGVFSTSVTTIDGNTKRIIATGYVPDSANPVAAKEIQVDSSIDTSIVSFRYGAQVGEGGVVMGNGSKIEGNIFSNGNISGGGLITGDATVAVGTASTVDQEWTVQNAGANVGDVSSNQNVAQSFRPSEDARLAKLQLNLKKVGNPSDLAVSIVTTSGSNPSSTVLATGTIPASSVTASYGYVDVVFSDSPMLSDDDTYWVVVTAPINSGNYFVWGRDSTGGYLRGNVKNKGPSGGWNNIAGDLNFKLYLSGAITSITGVTIQGDAWAHTLSSCTIGGDASYITLSSCPVTGTKYPGVEATTPIPFAISDAQIAEWENIAASGGTIVGPYTANGTVTLGPKKIAGDLTIGINSTLILTGPVWVEGNLVFGNNSTLTVSSGTGNNGAIIVAHDATSPGTKGIIDVSNNAIIQGNGVEGSFPMLISMNTGATAMILSNNAESAILYAPHGTIRIDNNAVLAQITAMRLDMGNNTTIRYVQGLQNAGFTNGPGGSWAVVPGSYAITK